MFDVESWEYGKNRNYNTMFDIPAKNMISVISGITENNGVNYYTKDILAPADIFEKELTISTRGEYSGTVFYHDEKFALANNILVMKMPNLSKRHKLFIGSVINVLPYGGYSNYPKKSTLANDKVFLPVTQSGGIDFDFMEYFIAELEAQRIAELEAQRIAELEAYLKAAGYIGGEGTRLTIKEAAALSAFNRHELALGTFKIGDLFDVETNPQLNKDSFTFSENGEYPYFTRTVFNNGIAGYVEYLNDTHKITGNCLAVGMIGMQFFYMAKDFYAGQFTKRVIPKNFVFTLRLSNYFISLLNKKQKIFQSVLVRDFEKVLKEEKIKLPITESGGIDFDFMETLISAIQKQVIQDVVHYADAKIAAAKSVVNR